MTAPVERQPLEFPGHFLRTSGVACSYSRWIVGHRDYGWVRDEQGGRTLVIPAAVQDRIILRRDQLHEAAQDYLLSLDPHANGTARDLWDAILNAVACLPISLEGGLHRRLIPDAGLSHTDTLALLRDHPDRGIVTGDYQPPTPDRDQWTFEKDLETYLHWKLTDTASGREYILVPESVQDHLMDRFGRLAQYTQIYLTENQPGGTGGPTQRTRIRLGTAIGTVGIARRVRSRVGVSAALDCERPDLAA